uniref:Putative ovule protein n=1 Tax=Solanum chacoense TaxID=4108 RepID=A0A0V0GE93_SOLCH
MMNAIFSTKIIKLGIFKLSPMIRPDLCNRVVQLSLSHFDKYHQHIISFIFGPLKHSPREP